MLGGEIMYILVGVLGIGAWYGRTQWVTYIQALPPAPTQALPLAPTQALPLAPHPSFPP